MGRERGEVLFRVGFRWHAKLWADSKSSQALVELIILVSLFFLFVSVRFSFAFSHFPCNKFDSLWLLIAILLFCFIKFEFEFEFLMVLHLLLLGVGIWACRSTQLIC